jgi:hypothetical protein
MADKPAVETVEAFPKVRVQFSRDHIHRGITYKPGDEDDLFEPEAKYLQEMGAVGIKPNGIPTKKLDVAKD